MRDLSKVGKSGVGKSRGYAFINFTEHSDALHALRATNNKQADIFGQKKVCMQLLHYHYILTELNISKTSRSAIAERPRHALFRFAKLLELHF